MDTGVTKLEVLSDTIVTEVITNEVVKRAVVVPQNTPTQDQSAFSIKNMFSSAYNDFKNWITGANIVNLEPDTTQSEVTQQVVTTHITRKKSLPYQIFDLIVNNPSVFIFIDGEGLLKTVNNILTYAEELLKACENSRNRKNIRSIVIHNAHGAIVSVERSSFSGQICDIPLAKSQFKTTDGNTIVLVQEPYGEGTNILLCPTACGFASIRKGMTLDEALQYYYRMRDIQRGPSFLTLLKSTTILQQAS